MKTSSYRVLGLVIFVSLSLLVVGCGGGGGSNENTTDDAELTSTQENTASGSLAWPVDCIIGDTCDPIGYPDIDGDWYAFDCGYPGYLGHIGTDISHTDGIAGVSVFAAADGQVAWVLDGRFDECQWTISEHPDCVDPSLPAGPGVTSGYMSCTDSRPEYCEGSAGLGSCYWCTYGANQIVIRHFGIPGVFGTTYDHLKMGSPTVRAGDWVIKGQKIAEIGSAGKSNGPHLHFGVLGTGFDQLVDPWSGPCGPNTTGTLWEPGIQEAATAPPPEDPWECDETSCVYTGDWDE